MTQQQKSNSKLSQDGDMTYLPQNAFKLILDFCDDRMEKRQRENHKQVCLSIDYMRTATFLLDKYHHPRSGDEDKRFPHQKLAIEHDNKIRQKIMKDLDDWVLLNVSKICYESSDLFEVYNYDESYCTLFYLFSDSQHTHEGWAWPYDDLYYGTEAYYQNW